MSKNVSVMFSGGLDSYIAYHYALKNGFVPQAIYVDMGHPYAAKEKESMDKSGIPYICLNMDSLFPALEPRLKNQIIPSRNVMLAVIGSMFNPRVWLGALDGEQNGKEHDKSPRFFQEATDLLSFTNAFFQERTIIETPFSHMTKADTIGWALKNGITAKDLLGTSSCYSGGESPCGECLTCYKRWAAFLLNDIIEDGHEKMRPYESEYAKNLELEIRQADLNQDYSRFTKSRIAEHNILKRKILTFQNSGVRV